MACRLEIYIRSNTDTPGSLGGTSTYVNVVHFAHAVSRVPHRRARKTTAVHEEASGGHHHRVLVGLALVVVEDDSLLVAREETCEKTYTKHKRIPPR